MISSLFEKYADLIERYPIFTYPLSFLALFGVFSIVAVLPIAYSFVFGGDTYTDISCTESEYFTDGANCTDYEMRESMSYQAALFDALQGSAYVAGLLTFLGMAFGIVQWCYSQVKDKLWDGIFYDSRQRLSFIFNWKFIVLLSLGILAGDYLGGFSLIPQLNSPVPVTTTSEVVLSASEPKTISNTILTEYQKDVLREDIWSDLLLTSVTDDPEKACSSLQKSSENNANAFNEYLDFYAFITEKYNDYRDDYPYIDKDLNAHQSLLETIRESCRKVEIEL